MKKRDGIIDFIVKPPMWVCIVMWVLSAVTLTGSIVLYYLGLGLKLWALPVHLSALVFFLISVYAVLTVIGIPKRAKNNVRVQEFFKSYTVRASVFAACSVIFNLCYVVFGIILAYLEKSLWLGVLVGYHIFLIFPRTTVFYLTKHGDGNKEEQELRAYAYCGFALMLLAMAVIPLIRTVLDDKNTYNYFVSGIIYVTAIAAYTFVKLGVSLYHLKKVRKTGDMSLIAIKNVSFADALISIFALQAMMLKVLGGTADTAVMNPVLGGLVAFGIFVMGLHMLVSGRKKLKSLQPESAQPTDEPDQIALEGE